MLGYPEAALADADRALCDAREIGHVATLMFALAVTWWTQINCGKYDTANALVDELVPLADEKGALYWKALGMLERGCIFALTGKGADAIQTLTSHSPRIGQRGQQ